MSNVDNVLAADNFYGPNPYSLYPNGPPMPGYVGTPTDAQGKPIVPPPGLTLNSAPPVAAPAAAPASVSSDAYIDRSSNGTRGSGGANVYGGGAGGQSNDLAPALTPGYNMALSQAQQAADPSGMGTGVGPAQPTPQDPSMAYAIGLLSNPGHVTTPGATMAPAAAPGPSQPNAMTQFLSSQNAKTGAGGYTNQGFFDTLNALKSNSTAPSSSLMPNPGALTASAFAPAKVGGLGGLGGV